MPDTHVSAPRGRFDGVVGDARKRLEAPWVAGREPMYRPIARSSNVVTFCRACELLRAKWGPAATCGNHVQGEVAR